MLYAVNFFYRKRNLRTPLAFVLFGIKKAMREFLYLETTKAGAKTPALSIRQIGFSGESPLTMRARCSGFRYCPDPLGIVTAKQLDKLDLLVYLFSAR